MECGTSLAPFLRNSLFRKVVLMAGTLGPNWTQKGLDMDQSMQVISNNGLPVVKLQVF